jgi:flagellar basal-body rod protein FlgB
MSILEDSTQRILAGALNGLSARQSLIASNIANIDTPGYAPQSIVFESALQSEIANSGPGGSAVAAGGMNPPSLGMSAAVGLTRTDSRHFAGSAPIATDAGAAAGSFAENLRNDTNTVDLESEMTALAESQLQFSAVSTLVSGKLGMLRDVASGGH